MRRIGVFATDLRGFLQVVPGDAQIPGQVVFGQQAKAGTPLRVLQATLLAAHAAVRAIGDHRLGTDAAHQRKFAMPGEDFLRVRFIHPGMRDNGVGHAVLRVDTGQPLGFGDLLAAIALGLDMHRADHFVQRGVAAIFGRQVIAAQAGVVAEPGMLAGLQPRVAQSAVQVPQVMVGIDDRDVEQRGFSFPSGRCRRTCRARRRRLPRIWSGQSDGSAATMISTT